MGKAKSASRSAARESLGVGVTNGTTAQEQLEHWGDSIPESKAIAHVAGKQTSHSKRGDIQQLNRLYNSGERLHSQRHRLLSYG